MTPRVRRAWVIGAGLLAFGTASGFVLNAFQSNLVFYFDPAQVVSDEVPLHTRFRLGGIVREGSVLRAASTTDITFDVTDGTASVPVRYSGFLPDMFREGKGVVAHGRLDASGTFHADQVLAKHDENYMPPEVAETLARSESAARGPGMAAAGQSRLASTIPTGAARQ